MCKLFHFQFEHTINSFLYNIRLFFYSSKFDFKTFFLDVIRQSFSICLGYWTKRIK